MRQSGHDLGFGKLQGWGAEVCLSDVSTCSTRWEMRPRTREQLKWWVSNVQKERAERPGAAPSGERPCDPGTEATGHAGV